MKLSSALILISSCLGSAHGQKRGNLRRLETPVQDCEDVKLQFTAPKLGGTPLPENPLNIVSQDTETVTLELTNPFSQTLGAAYFQYETAPGEFECKGYNNFAVSQAETVTVQCRSSEPFAIVTLIVTDPTAVSGDADIPICCHPDREGDPTVAYTFTVACVPQCEEAAPVAPEEPVLIEEVRTDPPIAVRTSAVASSGGGSLTPQRTSARVPQPASSAGLMPQRTSARVP